VRLGTHQFFDRQRTMKRRSLFVIAGLLLLFVRHAPAVRAQQRNNNTTGASGLALQNLSRVAASVAEIKAVLVKDAGLMVELKHWVAKDATDHGQIVSDSDLTSDAIFGRLETDIQFRSIATALVQRYGYLLPKLNPDSDLAKEHELLVQERTKWLAQNQEEELAQARQRGIRSPQNVGLCDPQLDKDCNASQTRSSTSGGFRQGPQQQEPPFRTAPPEPNSPNLPSGDGNPMLRAQLTQTAEDSGGMSSQFPSPGSYDSARSFNSLNVSALESLGSQTVGAGGPSGASLAGGNSNVGSAGDGLLAAYGMGTNPANGMLPDVSGINGAGNSPSASLGASPVAAMQPSNRRSPSVTLPQPPEMIRKQSPYDGIPSLYDMYVQAVTRPVTPRRFGAEVFENGTRDSQLIPMDLPVGPDYVVGPGDGLSIDLWGGVSQRLYRTVDREGRVSLPEVGPILVSGKSLAAVQQNLQQILRTQFRDVSADVSLARLRTIRVYEVGDVANPGAYDISSLSTPLNALFAAGGPTTRGSMRILKHYRGTQLVETVDVYDLLLHGVKTDLQRLENGDTVQIPPIGPEVTVEGMVRRPAIYELRDEKTLASVLELAGGLLPAAALRHIEVQRMVAHDKQTMLSVDIPEIENASEVTKKLESFEIHDGDRIRIYPIVPYNQDTIFIEGHVVRPGRYSFRAGMRVTDVLSSYKDLLPEPAAQYAEIIRLNAPDFHPSVEGFDLADALANPSQAPVLHAMDTVRIFSRFDFENPPTVSVLGDVRAPGTYRTSGQIHLTDAVHLAGGLTPDAQTADAQVFRYLPDGKFKIFSVGLSQALGGDPVENIILQPRDRLLIHRNPEAVEPATVYIQGEVVKPGRYQLAQGMRVSDLIRLGGGFKNSADLEMADLTEYLLQNKAAGVGAHHEVHISAALAGTPTDNLPLYNGDTLTIRQIPGWNDLGASVTVHGEVAHPGNYGIRPGERLSSVLARVGGFLPTAYPQGMILQREDVRQLEQKSREDLIQRIRQEATTFKASIQETAQDQAALAQAALAQRNNEIAALEQAPVTGRLVVRLPSDLARFRGSPDDIEVRRGDTLFIPKRPEFVVVAGQVYNSNAITYRAHRNAGWYLRQAGGPTDQANAKGIFIIRANGAVVSGQGRTLWNGGVLSTVVEAGDTIVVPEKAIGGSNGWKNLIAIAQLAQAAATTAFIATR
jgi:protein involved in polysaccharide export with SLBB domain